MSAERVKLTEARQAALVAISKGEVWNVRHGYGAWRIRGAPPSVVGALIQSLRLAAWAPRGGTDRQECVLTDAGRAILAGDPT